MNPYPEFDLESIESCSEIPACRGSEVLAILIAVDPIVGEEKGYQERVEKFSQNFIWRRITGDITAEFIDAAVERMFNADEVSGKVDLGKLKILKHKIIILFLGETPQTDLSP